MRTVEEIRADIDATINTERPRACLPESFKQWREWKLTGLKAELLDALIASIPLDRLAVICNAERDARCVVLPVKPTDTYYHRNYDTGELELNIELHGAMPDKTYREVNACAYWE